MCNNIFVKPSSHKPNSSSDSKSKLKHKKRTQTQLNNYIVRQIKYKHKNRIIQIENKI